MGAPLTAPTRTATIRARGLAAWLEVLPFLLPGLLLFGIFIAWPLIQGLRVSFYNWSIMPGADQEFVGLANFRRAFSDPIVPLAIGNTLVYVAVTVTGQMVFGMLAALGLNSAIRGRAVWRGLYYLPVVTSWVVVSFVFKYLFNGGGAPVNYILRDVLGLLPEYVDWLQHRWLAQVPITALGIWKGFGFTAVIFLAALQSVPADLLEAAAIDGAGRTQAFWRVTLPLLRPVLLYVLVILTIGGFEVFLSVVLMTGGGPMNQTQVILSYIYDQGFKYFEFGYGFALATLLGLLMLAINTVQFRLFTRKSEE